MAARPETPIREVVDLRHLASGSLDEVLDDETQRWRETPAWDFAASASLVKRFVDIQSLNGRALVAVSPVSGSVLWARGMLRFSFIENPHRTR